MPVIVFVSPKGGVGKSTSAVVLAGELSNEVAVTVIDADPNKPIKRWFDSANPSNITVDSAADETNILEHIEDAAATTPFVIVDLEGSAAKIVIWAISQADLVIIPVQGSELDAVQASQALNAIRQQEKVSRRKIPHAVLLTRTNTIIRTRGMAHIQKSMKEAGVPVLKTELNEREAFKAIFSFNRKLGDLDPQDVSNVDKAVANAQAYMNEVVALLREHKLADTQLTSEAQ
jgi:chromosome partitioning protein